MSLVSRQKSAKKRTQCEGDDAFVAAFEQTNVHHEPYVQALAISRRRLSVCELSMIVCKRDHIRSFVNMIPYKTLVGISPYF